MSLDTEQQTVPAPTKKAPLDFAQLDTKTAADAGTVVHLEDPRNGDLLHDDDGNAITITVLGSDSAKVRAFDRAATKRNLDRARRRGEFDIDVETVESNRVNRLAAATLAWSDNIVLDGAKLAFSEAEARRFYGDPRFSWVLEQLERAMGNRARFFANASGK